MATLALAEDAVSLDELAADPPERLALVLGTEGDGLSHHTLAAADLTVTHPDGRGSGLPQRGCGGRSGRLGPAPAAAGRLVCAERYLVESL